MWIILSSGLLVLGGAGGFVTGVKTHDATLRDLIHSLAIAQSAKETASYTRLLEGLRGGKTDLVTNRLETMLDHSIIEIGIETEFFGLPQNVDEAVSRSLCLARNYRELHPHRPSNDWWAKRYDAALALKTEHNGASLQSVGAIPRNSKLGARSRNAASARTLWPAAEACQPSTS